MSVEEACEREEAAWRKEEIARTCYEQDRRFWTGDIISERRARWEVARTDLEAAIQARQEVERHGR
jgi:hypothetical protein